MSGTVAVVTEIEVPTFSDADLDAFASTLDADFARPYKRRLRIGRARRPRAAFARLAATVTRIVTVLIDRARAVTALRAHAAVERRSRASSTCARLATVLVIAPGAPSLSAAA